MNLKIDDKVVFVADELWNPSKFCVSYAFKDQVGIVKDISENEITLWKFTRYDINGYVEFRVGIDRVEVVLQKISENHFENLKRQEMEITL